MDSVASRGRLTASFVLENCVLQVSGSRFEFSDYFMIATVPLGTTCRFKIHPGSRLAFPESYVGHRPYKLIARQLRSFRSNFLGGGASIFRDFTPWKQDPDRVEPIKQAGC